MPSFSAGFHRQDSIRQVLRQSSCDGPDQSSRRRSRPMSPVIITLLVLLGVGLLLALWLMYIYNGLVVAGNRFENAFAQIDVQLKRRYELIPNLVEAVKGYMGHERETLDAVLTSTENKIGFARQAFNDAATDYNIRREVFPAVKVAGIFGFKEAALLETAETERAAPRVSFQ